MPINESFNSTKMSIGFMNIFYDTCAIFIEYFTRFIIFFPYRILG